jgi:WD40 repeat protein
VFSPDGSLLALGSHDNTVRVWNVQTGQCENTLKGHSDLVNSVVLSPDGSRVASGSSDRTVRVWDIASSTEMFCYDVDTYIQQIDFSIDSSKILVEGKWSSLPSQKLLLHATATLPSSASGLPVRTLRVNSDWAISSSERILWLPPEYRPGTWASYSDTIVIGSGTGRVTFIQCAATRSSSS